MSGSQPFKYLWCFASVCRAHPQHWIESSPSWNLTVQDIAVTDFTFPAGYFLDDEVTAEYELLDGLYSVKYAGVPVNIMYNDISTHANVNAFFKNDMF